MATTRFRKGSGAKKKQATPVDEERISIGGGWVNPTDEDPVEIEEVFEFLRLARINIRLSRDLKIVTEEGTEITPDQLRISLFPNDYADEENRQPPINLVGYVKQ